MAPLNRFHVAVLVFWQFTILFATQMLFGIFTTYTPRWRCTSPGGNGDQNSSSPMSSRESAIVVAEEEADETEFGKDCAVYTQCPRLWLQFEQSPFASAAVDFDWICGPGAFNRALYSQIQFGGVLLGTFLMAPLSDRLGRKPVGLATLSLGILALALSSLSPTGLILLLARFLISLLMGGTLVVIATFTMELIPPEHRMILRTFCNWGTSRLIITFICFIFPNWRSASIAAALATTPALIILIFVLPESPIWLHSQGKMDKMRRSEQRIARFAGVPYVPVEYAPQSSKRANFLSLLRDRNLLCRLLVLWTMWFTSALSSYSIDLNSSNLSGDLFLNQLLLSFPIMLSKMFLFLLDSNWPGFSRRTLHQYSQAIVCLCFVLLTSVVLLDYDAPWLVLVLNQLGSAFIQYGWDACYVCALESMPTSVRSSSLGSCSLMSQFGAALAPLLVLLNDRWAASAYLAVAVVGSVNLVVSYCWLIDTKGIPLDAVGLVKEGTEKGNIGNKSKLAVMETEKFLPPPPIESC